MRSRIIDCVTFFNNNYIFDLRYNILKDVVDNFIVCESIFDHRGREKKIEFKNINTNKIKHIIMKEKFLDPHNPWKNQAQQREYLLKNLDFADPDDYIFFSDADEIPNPNLLENFNFKKKYGIFLQKCFNYKFNLFNKFESPWEGTRVSKKKNLNSIDFLRNKIKRKNLNYSFLRIDKEKSIQIFDNAGWHFNNVFTPKEISLKLKTFAHSEFSPEKFSSEEIIKKKIINKQDLFERGHLYEKVELDNSFPEFLLKNRDRYSKFIL